MTSYLAPLLALVAAVAVPLAPRAQQDPTPAGAHEPERAAPHESDAAAAAQDSEPARAQAPTRVTVGNVATVELPAQWRYLPAKEGQDFLVEIGNPRNPNVLGVALDDEHELFVVFFYNDDGHVNDEDAASIDFDALLHDMQESAREDSAERKRRNLATFELLGWAERPHYDATQKKLYYAERLRFSDTSGETLNYFVRILGRSGVLELNAVGDVGQLEQVAQGCKELLAATQFLPGKQYHEFDPSYDKIAAYGIGGLIAGKLLLKAGLFAGLLKMLAAFTKPLLIAGLAVLAFLGRMLTGKKKPAVAVAGAGSGDGGPAAARDDRAAGTRGER